MNRTSRENAGALGFQDTANLTAENASPRAGRREWIGLAVLAVPTLLVSLDLFVHMDQMGEVDYAPGEPKGTLWHPHRGFETVTYLIDGIFQHQDSNGGGGLITDGDTQWMTAGQSCQFAGRLSRANNVATAPRQAVARPAVPRDRFSYQAGWANEGPEAGCAADAAPAGGRRPGLDPGPARHVGTSAGEPVGTRPRV
jgi:Pirin